MNKHVFLCATAVALARAAAAQGFTNGTWTGAASANWSDPANWLNGDIADGAGAKLTVTGARGTLSLDGANGTRTVGAIHFDTTTGVTMNSNPAGAHSIRLDNNGAPVWLTASAQAAGNNLNGPFVIADNSTVIISNANNSAFSFINQQRVSGENIIIEHRSSGAGTTTTATHLGVNSNSDALTAEFHQFSATKSLNLCGGAVDETNLGNPRNSVWVRPGTRVAVRNTDNSIMPCLNPLRNIHLMGGPGDTIWIEQNNTNARSHIPGDVTGGVDVLVGYYLLGGRNTFHSLTSLTSDQPGILMASSDDNLGGPLAPLELRAQMLFILGRQMRDFGARPVVFESVAGNPFNLGMGVIHPLNTFTLDKPFGTTRTFGNLDNRGLFAKHGWGEVVIASPQDAAATGANACLLRLYGGTLTVDYAAGGSLRGTAVADGNNIGFCGGTLLLRGTGATGDIVQNLGNIQLDHDTAGNHMKGGRLVVDQRGATGTFTLNLGAFNAITARAGGTLAITTREDAPGRVTVTTTEANDASGMVGGGRVTFNRDFPSASAGGALQPAALVPQALAGENDNALATGNALVGATTTNNTLTLSSTGPGESLAIAPGAALFLKSGVILFNGDHDYTITGGALRSLRPEAAGTQSPNLIIHNTGAGTLFLETPVLSGASGLACFTKAGPGTVVLATNLWIAGAAYINEGTLAAGSFENLGRVISGVISNATYSTASSVMTCAMHELPPAFVPGRILFGTPAQTAVTRYVASISGGPGAWDIHLVNNNGVASTPTTSATDAMLAFSTDEARCPVFNNGRLRLLAPLETFADLGDTNVKQSKGGTFDVGDGQRILLTSESAATGNLTCLDNTGPAGDGVLRLQNTPMSNTFGCGLYLRRGVFETAKANSNAGIGTQSGVAPLMFADEDLFPATLRLYSPQNNDVKIAVSELSGANPSAIIEQTGNRAILFAVLNGADNVFGGVIRDRDPAAAGIPNAKINLLKAGCGTLTLDNHHTHTGWTHVNGGVLTVNGSLQSPVTVNKGAINGTGSIPSLLIAGEGAAVAPGAGPLTVTGDATLRGPILVEGVENPGPGSRVLYTCLGTAVLDDVTIANLPPNRHGGIKISGENIVLTLAVPGTLLFIR